MNFLDEMERLARAATPGPWVAAGYWDIQEAAHEGYDGTDVCNDAHPRKAENAAHIAAWSPDRALKVVEALRAAKALMTAWDGQDDDHSIDDMLRIGKSTDELRAALAALEEPR